MRQEQQGRVRQLLRMALAAICAGEDPWLKLQGKPIQW